MNNLHSFRFYFPPCLLALFGFEGTLSIYSPTYAPLAQLVEHLTLSQGVHGSSP